MRESIETIESGAGVLSRGSGGVLVAGGAVCLERGAIHEWFGRDPGIAGPGIPGLGWCPPMSVLIDLARRAADVDEVGGAGLVVWIGGACRPYPAALVARGPGGAPADTGLLRRSVVVEARTPDERLWSIDLALRSPGVAAVVADASGLSMSASRRLQLAAGRGGAVGLLARPPNERRALSSARTRWCVRPVGADESCGAPAWRIELTHTKSRTTVRGGATRWIARLNDDTRAIEAWQPEHNPQADHGGLAPTLAGGSGPAA